MKSPLKITALLLFFALASHAQITRDETVFITKGIPEGEKPPKEKPFFGQFSISIPLRANPYREDNIAYVDDDQNGVNDYEEDKYSALDYILPDGLAVNAGYGVHLKKWLGVSANTGVEYSGTNKLVIAPVFGSVLFTPQLWEETNICLQYGYGYAFALGRGDLGGTYQKYRIGAIKDNEVSLYVEANLYAFPLHEYDRVGTICIGLAFFDFL
ncbi:hypothetical protein FMM05_17605 [Flavobacterium zepuense]|uniref:Outer membrane protein beta-barrel domain-containing protein n=2 Tax=Flavobacterium zepuense TaxID=2593302 RepID=A0A552UVS4_9FLAO|nr:hypothetical protein FMM05_17605 [Flavobacterium zepuense]